MSDTGVVPPVPPSLRRSIGTVVSRG